MFKSMRQRRYEKLKSEGFLPFEAYRLSQFPIKATRAISSKRKRDIGRIAKVKGKRPTKDDLRVFIREEYASKNLLSDQKKADPVKLLMDFHGGASGFADYITSRDAWAPMIRKLIDNISPGKKKGHHGKHTLKSRWGTIDRDKIREKRREQKRKARQFKRLGIKDKETLNFG